MAFCFFVSWSTGVSAVQIQARDQTFINSIGMEFVLIPSGTFISSWTEKHFFDKPTKINKKRVVTISKPFYLGKYEVTQEQWQRILGYSRNPLKFEKSNSPVANIKFEDVQTFIDTLNALENTDKYFLPTDAQWEHAARAGTNTNWFFGDNPADLIEYGWFAGNYERFPQPVGQLKPNPWGLYDVYGNVAELVQDLADRDYASGTFIDPTGPSGKIFTENENPLRVFRGGYMRDYADDCQSFSRSMGEDSTFGGSRKLVGFRLAFFPETNGQSEKQLQPEISAHPESDPTDSPVPEL
jgi:formylglycine-generating enzyme required for sulfatase activity